MFFSNAMFQINICIGNCQTCFQNNYFQFYLIIFYWVIKCIFFPLNFCVFFQTDQRIFGLIPGISTGNSGTDNLINGKFKNLAVSHVLIVEHENPPFIIFNKN